MSFAQNRLSIPKPSAVLFDWGRTLINPNRAYSAALELTIREMANKGFDLKKERPDVTSYGVLSDPKTRGRITDYMREAYATAFGQDVANEAIQLYKEHLKKLNAKPPVQEQGAEGILRLLESKNIPIAIVSNKTQESLEREFKLVFGERFSSITLIGKCKDRAIKPDPAPLIEAMDILGIPQCQREQVWMVGDGLNTDVQAARNTDCIPVWFGKTAASTDSARARGSDVIAVPNLTKLCILVTRGCNQDLQL